VIVTVPAIRYSLRLRATEKSRSAKLLRLFLLAVESWGTTESLIEVPSSKRSVSDREKKFQGQKNKSI
jgi:cystathionine beta-lyase/cystathionine gamma-synthase